jgi:hypothetical protein
MLKLMAAEDSLEEKRLTGTETSPKEIVAEPMVLAAIEGLIYRQNSHPARGAREAGWNAGLAQSERWV